MNAIPCDGLSTAAPFGPPHVSPTRGESARCRQRTFEDVLAESPARSIPVAHPTADQALAPPAAVHGDAATAIRRLLDGALTADRRVESLIADATSGRTLSAAELIALQSEVFRHAQVVEVISRTTDRMVGAIKQTLSTQV